MGYDSVGDFCPLLFGALLRPKRKADGSYTFTWFQGGAAVEAERIATPFAPVGGECLALGFDQLGTGTTINAVALLRAPRLPGSLARCEGVRLRLVASRRLPAQAPTLCGQSSGGLRGYAGLMRESDAYIPGRRRPRMPIAVSAAAATRIAASVMFGT